MPSDAGAPTTPVGSPSAKPKKPADDRREEVDALFAHYRAVISEHSRMDLEPFRKLVVRDLKRGYTVEQQKACIGALRVSEHHNGRNDRGKRYLGPDQIWKKEDLTKIAWWLARVEDERPAMATVTSIAAARAYRDEPCACPKPTVGIDPYCKVGYCSQCRGKVKRSA